MLTLDRFTDIRLLHRQGHSIGEIARLSGHSRNTVRPMLPAEHSPRPTPRSRPTAIDGFKDYLQQRWTEHQLSAVRLHEEIVAQGYGGGMRPVRRFIARLGLRIRSAASSPCASRPRPANRSKLTGPRSVAILSPTVA